MADDKTVTQKISIKRGDATLILDLSSVAAFVADDRLTFAWVGEKEYPVYHTMEMLEEKLAAERFFRVHRSALVNLEAIREIHTWFGGKLRLRLKGSNRELTVNRRR